MESTSNFIQETESTVSFQFTPQTVSSKLEQQQGEVQGKQVSVLISGVSLTKSLVNKISTLFQKHRATLAYINIEGVSLKKKEKMVQLLSSLEAIQQLEQVTLRYFNNKPRLSEIDEEVERLRQRGLKLEIDPCDVSKEELLELIKQHLELENTIEKRKEQENEFEQDLVQLTEEVNLKREELDQFKQETEKSRQALQELKQKLAQLSCD